MRKLLYEVYNALASLLTILVPPEPEPGPQVTTTRKKKTGGK